MQPASKTSSPFPHRGLERPASDGTVAAALAGIRLEDFIEMTRPLARESDSGAARFLDAWNAFERSEQEATGAADAVCERLGITPLTEIRSEHRREHRQQIPESQAPLAQGCLRQPRRSAQAEAGDGRVFGAARTESVRVLRP